MSEVARNYEKQRTKDDQGYYLLRSISRIFYFESVHYSFLFNLFRDSFFTVCPVYAYSFWVPKEIFLTVASRRIMTEAIRRKPLITIMSTAWPNVIPSYVRTRTFKCTWKWRLWVRFTLSYKRFCSSTKQQSCRC